MAFHKFPDQRSKLSRTAACCRTRVEENSCAMTPPSQLQGRTTTREVTLHGVTIPAVQDHAPCRQCNAAIRAFRGARCIQHRATSSTTNRSSSLWCSQVAWGIHLARRNCDRVRRAVQPLSQLGSRPTRITRSILSNVRGVDSLANPARQARLEGHWKIRAGLASVVGRTISIDFSKVVR